MKKLGIKQIVIGVLEIGLGIFMFTQFGNAFNIYVTIICGLIILDSGVELFIQLRNRAPGYKVRLTSSVLLISMSTLILIAPLIGLNIINIIVGVIILIVGATRVYSTYKKTKNISFFSAAAMLIGLLIIVDPQLAAGFASAFISIFLIIIGAIQIFVGLIVTRVISPNIPTGRFGNLPEEKDDTIDVEYEDLD